MSRITASKIARRFARVEIPVKKKAEDGSEITVPVKLTIKKNVADVAVERMKVGVCRICRGEVLASPGQVISTPNLHKRCKRR